jgi:hypothetical protein
VARVAGFVRPGVGGGVVFRSLSGTGGLERVSGELEIAGGYKIGGGLSHDWFCMGLSELGDLSNWLGINQSHR